MSESTQTFEDRLSMIHRALEEERGDRVTQVMSDLEPAEIGLLLESLPTNERRRLWQQVPVEVDGEVLLHVHDDVRGTLISEMQPGEIVAATAGLDTADLAELFEDLPRQVAEDVLGSMDALQRLRLKETLSFEEGSAGRLLRTDSIAIRPDVSLETVQRFLRWKASLPDNIDRLMVVDRGGRFLGALSLSQLVANDPEMNVSELMDSEVDIILGSMRARDVATLFETHDLISAPMVDDDGMLLGRIVIDDMVDVMLEDSEQTLLNMAGLDEEEDLFAPLFSSAKRRAVWLGINLITAFLAAWVIGRFENVLDRVVALAVLMPIVASMGGIAGSQTLTLAIRGMALGQISRTNRGWLLRKEVAIAALNGVLWSLVVAALAMLWFDSLAIGAILAAALVINMLAAGFAGIVVPLVLKRMGADPALSGSVILTTVTDVIGFMSFLGLATLFLL